MTRYLIPPTPSEDLPPPPPTAQDFNIPDEAYGARTLFGSLQPGEQLPSEYWDEVNRANSTRAAELQNQFLDRQREILHTGPDAYLGKTGRDAVLAAPDVLAKLEAARQDTIGQAANEAQRRLLTSALGEHRITEHYRVGTHAGEQSLEWQKQTATERLNQLRQQASLDYTDPESIEAYGRASESAARERAWTLRFGPKSDETFREVEGARSAIWRSAIEAALGKFDTKSAIILYNRAADRMTPADADVLAPQVDAAKEHEAGQAYLANVPIPDTRDLDELHAAHQAATAQNEADWPDNDGQRATNQHFIDVAFGQKKRDAVQAKMSLNQKVNDWLNQPGQAERPPLDLWKRMSAADSLLAENAEHSSQSPSVMSDALPEPLEEGRQYAQASRGNSARRGTSGRELAPMEEMRSENFESHLEAIRQIEPNNRELSYVAPPGWVPTERDVARVHEELLRARQRAAGAQSPSEALAPSRSRIGPGPYAGESIPARSPARNFTAKERAEINRIGSETGCHTCGSRNPGTKSGNFILDHQLPSALNPLGVEQRLFPHCLSCSLRQGGLISREVQREKP